MLYITHSYEEEGVIIYPSGVFDSKYTVDWLNNPLAKEIIKGIDNSEHVQDHIIMSPVFGAIPPRMLSTGCKGVLLLLNMPSGTKIRGERFGDNCFEWLSKVGEVKDIYITLHHYLDDYDIPMTAVMTNNGKTVHSSGDLNTEILCIAHGVDSGEIKRKLGMNV